MQALATTGEYTNIPAINARSWPLAGSQYAAEYGQGWSGLRMSALPTGEARILSYPKIYKSNPWVWAAVNAIARGLASNPLRVYQYGGSGQSVPVRADWPRTTGPLSKGKKLDNLLNHPSPGMSRRKLIRRAAVDTLIYGNGLWIKEADGYGGVRGLWNAPWRSVAVKAGTSTPVDSYRVDGAMGSKWFAPEDVIHFGEGDPDSPISPSPLEPLQWTIALADAMSRHLVAYFQNSARPSGVLQMEQMPDDKDLAMIREQIQQLYSGSENAGRPLITSGKWSPMSNGSNTADLVELARLSREEVAAAYSIPPPVMGILENAIKANVEELREQYLRDVLAVHGSMFTDEIQAQLCDPTSDWSGYQVKFDFSERLLPDLEALAVAFKDLKRVYTINELRRLVNLEDLDFDWANQPWMEPGSLPAGLAPMGATVNPEDQEGQPVSPPSDPPEDDPKPDDPKEEDD